MESLPHGLGSGIRKSRRAFIIGIGVLLLSAGCTTLHVPGPSSARDSHSGVSKRGSASQANRKPGKKKAPWLASWFGPKKPPPPKSVKEWMQRSKQVRVTDPEASGS